jgi:beta-lactam-binding protein with PASTA domain
VKKRKGATGATGKVVKQSAKPGTILAPGAKVKVTLGP